jgi:hypothetical protein
VRGDVHDGHDGEPADEDRRGPEPPLAGQGHHGDQDECGCHRHVLDAQPRQRRDCGGEGRELDASPAPGQRGDRRRDGQRRGKLGVHL